MPFSTLDRPVYEAKAELFKALGHPVRIRILELLSEHPDVVTTLAQHWPIGVPTLKSDHVHSVDELDAIAAVLSKVEAGAALPFPEQSYPGHQSNTHK